MNNFDSLLIANRGEIAVRVIRSARRLGLRTIAIYSDADAGALHVQAADDAICIGGASAASSYLSLEKVLDAAVQSRAGAIHPGYGFLSENADFASAVEAAGLIFVGPSPQAIALMGDKAAAKRHMIQAGVACVPGYQEEEQDDDALLSAAQRIGYPVMIKATAGGGGRGMRLARDAAQMPELLASARSEALNAFGSDRLIIEKAVQAPRHIEVQVFADQHGRVVHLGERDCSVQRRHQKVIEEAPFANMTPELRDAMGQAAVSAARSIEYRGAGTVEFLLDEQQNYYFLEMNTRLQVEHPVTEMVTGFDLVQWQLRVADGEPLEMAQKDLQLGGHAIEARLYAEDPAAGFLPATGVVGRWQVPGSEAGDSCKIRVDTGISDGQVVSPFYDPMLAKVIAWGPTREQARQALVGALQQADVLGVITNRAFLIDVLKAPAFVAGDVTTDFLDTAFNAHSMTASSPKAHELAGVGLVLFHAARERALADSLNVPDQLLNWSSGSPVSSVFTIGLRDEAWTLQITPRDSHDYLVAIEPQPSVVSGEAGKPAITVEISACMVCAEQLDFRLDEQRHRGRYALLKADRVHLSGIGQDRIYTDLTRQQGAGGTQADSGQVKAPMHGVLIDLLVQVGDEVTGDQKLGAIEAMKMQHDLRAGCDGKVVAVNAATGEQVAEGQVVIEISGSAPTDTVAGETQ